MADFDAGKWLIGLSVYFFLMFLIVFSIVQASSTHAYIDSSGVSANDPGFQTEDNQMLGEAGCYGQQQRDFCIYFDFSENETCEIVGCEPIVTVWGDFACTGYIDAVNCSDLNQSDCNVFPGCHYEGGGDSDISAGTVRATFGILTGVGSDDISIGLPAGWNWVFSFIFFWIPGVMLLWALYQTIPFIN